MVDSSPTPWLSVTRIIGPECFVSVSVARTDFESLARADLGTLEGPIGSQLRLSR